MEEWDCLWVRVSVFLQPWGQIPGGVGAGGPGGDRHSLHPDWGLCGSVARGATGERNMNRGELILSRLRIPFLKLIFPILEQSILTQLQRN